MTRRIAPACVDDGHRPLRASSGRDLDLFWRCYSAAAGSGSAGDGGDAGDSAQPELSAALEPEQPLQQLPGGPPVPATQTVPEEWPVVPVVAVNRHPVFPKFVKIVEVTDEALMKVLRRKVKLNQPYAGVFVKRDDDNEKEVVDDVADVYPTGTFAQIMELQDLGSRLRMVVMGHRRICITGKAVEEDEAQGEVKEGAAPPVVDDRLLAVETENIGKETFDVTDEMKALTQEVIKTIRDIIVSLVSCLYPVTAVKHLLFRRPSILCIETRCNRC